MPFRKAKLIKQCPVRKITGFGDEKPVWNLVTASFSQQKSVWCTHPGQICFTSHVHLRIQFLGTENATMHCLSGGMRKTLVYPAETVQETIFYKIRQYWQLIKRFIPLIAFDIRFILRTENLLKVRIFNRFLLQYYHINSSICTSLTVLTQTYIPYWSFVSNNAFSKLSVCHLHCKNSPFNCNVVNYGIIFISSPGRHTHSTAIQILVWVDW